MSYTAIPLEAGEVVYQRGEDSACMFLVQHGAVEMLDDSRAGERLALFERGDFFGEQALLEHVTRENTFRATESSRLIRVDSDDLAHMLARNPEIAVRMIRKLARRLLAIETRLCAQLVAAHASEHTEGASVAYARLVYAGDGDDTPILFALDGETSTIGRTDPLSGVAPDVDLSPLDPQLTTSRQHARIDRDAEAFVLIEKRATNGTFVNGKRLQPGSPLRLTGGEELVFGNVALRFECSIQPPRVRPSGPGSPPPVAGNGARSSRQQSSRQQSSGKQRA